MARRHLVNSDQFWFAATKLIGRNALSAGCENLFGAAELAVMAIIEASGAVTSSHRARSAWLLDHGHTLGLSADQCAALGSLLSARNSYRYGDHRVNVSPMQLIELVPAVEAIRAAAKREIGVTKAVAEQETETTP